MAFGCSAQPARPLSGVVSVDGTLLPYIVEGEGMPTLVTCDTVPAQRAFSPELRNHLRLVFMDPRVGAKHEHSVDYASITMDTLVDDIEQIRVHLQLERIAVVGHSICGTFALEYARRYPDNVSHVIMIGTPPRVDAGLEAASENYWNTDASEERRAALNQNRAALTRDLLSQMTPSEVAIAEEVADGPRRWHDPRYDASWLLEGYYYNVEGWNQVFNVIMADYDVTNGTDIVAPIFLALGRHDFVVPPTIWDDVRDRFGNLTYTVFVSSGHSPHVEEQELFERTLLEWIASN
jgi:proline iminopeptidase